MLKDKFYYQRRFNLCNGKIQKIKDGLNQVEIVDIDEVYLIQNSKRIKRICGASTSGLPEGYYCLSRAGHRTSHPGIGRCYLHEGSKEFRANFWLRQINPQIESHRFVNILDKVSKIEEEDLFSQEHSLRILYSMVIEHVEKISGDWDKDSQTTLVNILDEIRKVQEVRAKIERGLVFDVAAIEKFLKEIFSVIRKYVSRTIITKIKSEIMNQITISLAEDAEFKKVEKEINLLTKPKDEPRILQDSAESDREVSPEF